MCHLKHKSKLDSIEIHRLAAAKEGPFFSSQENINIQNPILGFDTALLLPPQQTSENLRWYFRSSKRKRGNAGLVLRFDELLAKQSEQQSNGERGVLSPRGKCPIQRFMSSVFEEVQELGREKAPALNV